MARVKHKGHIDPSTGRNKRDKSTERETHGGPERWNGKIVKGGRLAHQRDRKTGKK